MMKITDISVYPYHIPLRSTFTTAHSALALRAGAIVEITTTDSEITGVGEIAPLPEFSGSTLATALASLPTIAAQLRGQPLIEALHTLHKEAQVLPAPAVYGLEVALFDALGKTELRSISNLLSTQPSTHVRVNAVIGATNTEEAVKQAQRTVAAGFGCVKLKVGQGSGSDVERIAAVREAIGPTTHLRLDANEAWTVEQARVILTASTRYAIQYVEQPLPASNLSGMRELRRSVAIPLAADEAVHDLASARSVLATQAADILIVKPQLAGGLHTGRQIIQEAAEQGVQSVITSTIEAGVGLVAALHLAAASPEVTLECGLATLHLLEDDLLRDDLPVDNGILAVPTAPGLGVQLDRQALTTYTSHRKEDLQ